MLKNKYTMYKYASTIDNDVYNFIADTKPLDVKETTRTSAIAGGLIGIVPGALVGGAIGGLKGSVIGAGVAGGLGAISSGRSGRRFALETHDRDKILSRAKKYQAEYELAKEDLVNLGANSKERADILKHIRSLPAYEKAELHDYSQMGYSSDIADILHPAAAFNMNARHLKEHGSNMWGDNYVDDVTERYNKYKEGN